MTEQGVLALVGLIVTLLTGANGLFTYLSNRKLTKQNEDLAKQNTELDKRASADAKVIQKQNAEQTKAITKVQEAQEQSHDMQNSRLDEWKKEHMLREKEAIEAAVLRGLAQGMELERARSEKAAAETLAEAKRIADDVIATAKLAADKLVAVAASLGKRK